MLSMGRIIDTKSCVFTANELYTSLVKGVFNTYSFPDSKWKTSVTGFGRSFFDDRKNKKNPFIGDCCDNFHILYEEALKGNLTKPSAKQISVNLNNQLSKKFKSDFGFLVFYEDDSEELRDLKIKYWIILIDKITNKASEKEEFVLLDQYILADEEDSFRKNIRKIAEGTISHGLAEKKAESEDNNSDNRFEYSQNYKPDEIQETIDYVKKYTTDTERVLRIADQVNLTTLNIIKKYDQSQADTDKKHEEHLRHNVINNTFGTQKQVVNPIFDVLIKNYQHTGSGKFIYFLNSSICGVSTFLEFYEEFTRLDIHKCPALACYNKPVSEDMKGRTFITYDSVKQIDRSDWDYHCGAKNIFPTMENDFYGIGYDILSIKGSLQQGKSFYSFGSPAECLGLGEYINIDKVILVVPRHMQQLIYQLQIKGYSSMDAAEIRISELIKNLDYVLKKLYTTPQKYGDETCNYCIIQWDEDHIKENFMYYAGLTDGIINGTQIEKTMALDFLRDYKDFLENVIIKKG